MTDSGRGSEARGSTMWWRRRGIARASSQSRGQLCDVHCREPSNAGPGVILLERESGSGRVARPIGQERLVSETTFVMLIDESAHSDSLPPKSCLGLLSHLPCPSAFLPGVRQVCGQCSTSP